MSDLWEEDPSQAWGADEEDSLEESEIGIVNSQVVCPNCGHLFEPPKSKVFQKDSNA